MKRGFVLVENTPYDDPDKTRQLLEHIGPIRHTHYGGFYDFTPDLSMADTAYTNLALPAHTDTTYFTDPAGLQSFHLLSHRPAPGSAEGPKAEGGKSLLVDGFHAARVLFQEDPEAWRILSNVLVHWHASGNDGISIRPEELRPVITAGTELGSGTPRQIRWNNADRGVVELDPTLEPDAWYRAARAWDSILKRPDMECWIQLEPGMVLSACFLQALGVPVCTRADHDFTFSL